MVNGVPRLFASQVAVLFGAPFVVSNEPDGELSEGAGKRGSTTGYTRVDIPRASVDRDGYLAAEDFADFASGSAGAFSAVRTVTASTSAITGEILLCDQASVAAGFTVPLPDPADTAPGAILALQAVRPTLTTSHTATASAGYVGATGTGTSITFGDGASINELVLASNGVDRWISVIPNPRTYPAIGFATGGTLYGSAGAGGNLWFFGGAATVYVFDGLLTLSGSDGIELVGVEYFSEQDEPATPAAGTAVRWLDAITGKLMLKYDDGVVREVLTSP